MISASQLRAARGLLNWTRSDLSKASGVSAETIKNFEHDIYTPQESTSDAITKAFAAHDVEFFENDGVRKNNNLVIGYDGKSNFRKYVDDFYNALSNLEKDFLVCTVGIDDRLFVEALGDYAKDHAERMSKLKNLQFRSLVRSRECALFPSYIEYRILPDIPLKVLFGIYGNRFDLTIYGEGNEYPKVVVIKSNTVVEAYRIQFEALWKVATPI